MAKKATEKPEGKPCPITREAFLRDAKPLSVTIGGVPMAATVKEFSTGSFGWYVSGKVPIEVGGVPLSVQVGLNLIVVGSKGPA